jgi:hypothetical protein
MQQVVFLILESILSLFFQKKKKQVTQGLHSTIPRLVPDDDTQDVISGQHEEYKKAIGDFGMPLAIRKKKEVKSR